jgi:hypothetical protein
MNEKSREDDQDPIFEVFCYSHPDFWNDCLEAIANKWPTSDTSHSFKNDSFINVIFHKFVDYDEAKEIMFWFYFNVGDSFHNGWNANYEIDKRLDNVFNEWIEQEYGG